jgi:uncharacterized membrane protein YfcA
VLFLWQACNYVKHHKQGADRKKTAIYLGGVLFVLAMISFFLGIIYHKAWHIQGIIFLIAMYDMVEGSRFRYNKKG